MLIFITSLVYGAASQLEQLSKSSLKSQVRQRELSLSKSQVPNKHATATLSRVPPRAELDEITLFLILAHWPHCVKTINKTRSRPTYYITYYTAVRGVAYRHTTHHTRNIYIYIYI